MKNIFINDVREATAPEMRSPKRPLKIGKDFSGRVLEESTWGWQLC
jgi:hypothetical protein